MATPSKERLLRVLSESGGALTYVVRNMLNARDRARCYPYLKTDDVRKALYKLAISGEVERVESRYAWHIAWRITPMGEGWLASHGGD